MAYAPSTCSAFNQLFTDFTSSNLGVPSNPAIPYFNYNKPDRYGFTANLAGSTFVDKGVGDFLRDLRLYPNSDWARLAPQFDGKFQVSTLCNVDKRPRPDFVKAYMHNGYLKSLKEVVHFYNTRDNFHVVSMALREKRRNDGSRPR
jgi:cytochrome c peroxidase